MKGFIMEKKELVLKDLDVIFAELEDKGYGLSITIDATAPAIHKAITEWVKANNINGGEAKFKHYTGKDGVEVIQYQFKISKYTDFRFASSEVEDAGLGYGAKINIVARAFEYSNKFGTGISSSLSAVFVKEGAKNSAMTKIAE